MNWIDYSIIIVLVFTGLIGYSKGFAKMTSSFVSFIIALLASVFLSSNVTDFIITQTPIGATISRALNQSILGATSTTVIQENLSNLQGFLAENPYLSTVLGNSTIDYTGMTLGNFISFAIIEISVIVVLMIAFNVLLSLLFNIILSFQQKTPKLSQVNRLLGFVFGALTGLLCLIIFFKFSCGLFIIDASNPLLEGIYSSQLGASIVEFPLIEYVKNFEGYIVK